MVVRHKEVQIGEARAENNARRADGILPNGNKGIERDAVSRKRCTKNEEA